MAQPSTDRDPPARSRAGASNEHQDAPGPAADQVLPQTPEPEPGPEPVPFARTFIVRMSVDPPAGLSGTVESARSGQKQRFRGTGEIGPVIEHLLASTPPPEHLSAEGREEP